MIGDLAEGELLPGRLYLCGGGAELRQIGEALAGNEWWRACRSRDARTRSS